MEGSDLQHYCEADTHSAVDSEDTPLLEKELSHWSVLAMRYRNTRKCISSKAALLILFWSFTVAQANMLLIKPDVFYVNVSPLTFMIIACGVTNFILILYPLAGFLADVKFGRYKTVLRSLDLIVPSVVMVSVLGGWGIAISYEPHVGFTKLNMTSILLLAMASVPAIILLAGLAGFTANIIPFGMDQLHDSPGEDRTLFIHWYVWSFYISLVITQLSSFAFYNNFNEGNYTAVGILSAVGLIIVILLVISVCLGHRGEKWFLIEPGTVNPYKLVYRVSKFAYQHRIPVQRSAFTYCEDELSSGLDLGKNKYGGPFTTEEVEDVKAFYGILKVLFILGIWFFLDFGAKSLQPVFFSYYYPYDNTSGYNETLSTQNVLIGQSILSHLLVVVFIPLYLVVLHPFISLFIPGILKRMGIGMCLVLLSLMLPFPLDTAAHNMHKNSLCMFTDMRTSLSLQSTAYIFIIQNVLSALSSLLIHVGVFEFICSQSPHSMKGMLNGLLYAIKGLYQMLAAVLVVPYMLFWSKSLPISCGFGYYLMNILIGVFAVVVYMCVARRYKYRE